MYFSLDILLHVRYKGFLQGFDILKFLQHVRVLACRSAIHCAYDLCFWQHLKRDKSRSYRRVSSHIERL